MNNKKKGFTLVEVIVASMILVVACIPLLSAFVTSSKVNMMGRRREQSMVVAENIMEGIKACGPVNAYKWAAGQTVNCSVIPGNSEMTKTATAYSDKLPAKDFSSYELTNGDKLADIDEKYASKSITVKDYILKIDKVLMGASYYDAIVVIRQSVDDIENYIACLYEDDINPAAGVSIMKYYEVEVFVVATGDFDSVTLPEVKEANENLNDAQIKTFKNTLSNLAVAKYQGTIISEM